MFVFMAKDGGLMARFQISTHGRGPPSVLFLGHLEGGSRARNGGATTPGDGKALAPEAYSQSPSTVFGEYFQKRAENVHEDCHKATKKPGGRLGTAAGATGPAEAEMDTGNSEVVSAFVVGVFGGASTQVQEQGNLHSGDPPLDRTCCTPRMGQSSSLRAPWPRRGPTAAAYPHTRERLGRRRGT